MFTAYILQNEKDGKYYIGSTDDITQRLLKHSKGYSQYTKNRGPFEVIYKEIYNTRSEAKKREYYLKSLKSRSIIEKIIRQASLPVQ